jgi:hypothetical protein
MNEDPRETLPYTFRARVASITAGLFAMSGMISLCSTLPFGISLFCSGVFTALLGGVFGAALGSPRQSGPDIPINMSIGISGPGLPGPFGQRRSLSINKLKHSVPTHRPENAILFAGWAAILLSLPFLAWIMFT